MRAWALCLALAACGDDAMTPTGDGSMPTPDSPPAVVEDIHFIGRFDAMHRFAWPGSQIRTRFEGTTISIDLDDSGMSYYDVTIDGTTTTVHPASGRHMLALASGLPAGMHDLAFSRRTESFFGIATFYGFSGATLIPTARPQRLIEFIGDSITCGYGVLGAVATCNFTADTEAETHAWGTFASTALDAVHVSIAYSGLGMYRNYGGDTSPTIPQRYGRTFADDNASTWDFSYTPDVVVINLGTNDFSGGDPGAPFVTAYVGFVQMLRSKFGNAAIVLAASPMLGAPDHAKHKAYLDQVASMVADANVSVVDIATQLASDGYGCDYHPNEVTQHKMSDQLVPAIRAATGW
ncbi:MAG TPA: GDSL-type esterase/lipase family protein [Kofleriaceae bacterium]|nr:GDSL-type esterase/lipase family protein [Kofleriaceae bacterium]